MSSNIAILKYNDDLVYASVIDTEQDQAVETILSEHMAGWDTEYYFDADTKNIKVVDPVPHLLTEFEQTEFPCIAFGGSFSEFDEADSLLDMIERVREKQGWEHYQHKHMPGKRTLVIFGASDPESVRAREILASHHPSISTATATVSGKPVHADNAYKADGYQIDSQNPDTTEFDIIIKFECAVSGLEGLGMLCDHHNPGDPGWGYGSRQYWMGSSLGQLCSILGHHPSIQDRMIAAGNHCPAAAYQGLCNGVDPAKFAEMRIEQKVAFYATNAKLAYKASMDTIKHLMNAAYEKLSDAPIIEMGGIEVRDMRTFGEVDEFPEAALKAGRAYIASLAETDQDRNPTGNVKIVLGGHATPEAVNAFLDWAHTLQDRVGEPYGNPDRGYAGVVVRG